MVQWRDLGAVLQRGASVPLYRQLSEEIARYITTGLLPPGAKLPPSRELSRRLGVNRATVANAYDALVTRGLIRSHVGRGTFVTGGLETPSPSSAWALSRGMEAMSRRPRWSAPTSEDPDSVDFAALVPDEELFPIEPFRKALNAVMKHRGKELLQYGPPAGYPPLRAYIAERLGERGVPATADNILIVNGSQQGLDLVCRALVDPGDLVAVESPTYHVVPPLIRQYQAQTVAVPMTRRGMDLDALDALLARRRVKLIYTMPTFHNPTGITMELGARQKLIERAKSHQVPIIEDDYDSELRFDGRAVPPLIALDRTGLVLHLGTFSKGLFPGLRLGWMVAPRGMIEPLSRAKLFSDYHTSPLLQAAVLEFCRGGHYDEHLRHLARVYREKSRRLIEAMARHFPPEVTWTEPEGGYAFWVTLPEGVSSEVLETESHSAGVLFTPGRHFFTGSEGDRFLRLSISRVPSSRLEEGVRRLGALIRKRIQDMKAGLSEPRVEEPVFHI